MFIKSKLTRKQILKRRMHNIDGKSIKEKFSSVMKEVLVVLENIKDFNKYYDKKIAAKISSIIFDYEDSTIVSSQQKVLYFLIECHDDLNQLYDDMIFHIETQTYDDRLLNAINFLSDLNHKTYNKYAKFYQDTKDSLAIRIKAVSKSIHFKVGKLESTIESLSKKIQLYENENIKYASEISSVNKSSHKYSELAAKVTDNHKQINYQSGVIKLTRKMKNSYEIIANMLDQLAILEEYQKNLKSDGYIKRLVNKLYRNPEKLDLMDNTADLADILTKVKDEINTIESIAAPAQKMIFSETTDNIDEDVVNNYINLSEKE